MNELKKQAGGPMVHDSGSSFMEGDEQSDLVLPRLHLIQGLPEEKKRYGSHAAGTWVNTLTQEELDDPQFTPVIGWVDYVKYNEPRGNGIEYITRDKSEVPRADLEWDRSAMPAKPPKCSRRMNYIVLVDGYNMPLVILFGSTKTQAGKDLYSLEKLRGERGRGLYAVEQRDQQNAKGSWIGIKIRSVGDPPDKLKAAAAECFNNFQGKTVITDEDVTDAPDNGDSPNPPASSDDIPF